jgi:zinc/manganese transport system substrate-binding protein
MRRATRAVVVAALATSGLTACGGSGDDRPLVVVSTNILGDVVEQVVGEQAEVVTLMKPDSDPHSFEVSAREAGRMRGADLLVSNGLGLEEGLQQHLDAAAEEGVATYVAGDAVDVLDYAEGDAAGTPDPHFWTDPARMVDVVEGLVDALAEVDGIEADAVRADADDYLADVRAVDDEMADVFAAIPAERRALVTNHHVFGYLAERYDFDVVGAVIPGGTTLAAPSASDLSDLATAIEETGVRAVFAESSSPDRLVQALADEVGLDVEVLELYSESLTAPDGGAPDYLTMMRVNAERIASGLS